MKLQRAARRLATMEIVQKRSYGGDFSRSPGNDSFAGRVSIPDALADGTFPRKEDMAWRKILRNGCALTVAIASPGDLRETSVPNAD